MLKRIAGLVLVVASLVPGSFAHAAKIRVIGHQVDTQDTFAQAHEGAPDGSLAVSGSGQTIPNIVRLANAFANTRGAKSIASIDYHYEVEMKVPGVNDEFKIFPSHGRAEFSNGAEGHQRIAGVAHAFADDRQLSVPHHKPNSSNTGLDLVDFDLESSRRAILDSRVEIVIQKNGPGSYDVFANPRTEKIYEMIDPTKELPIHVYGWATDYCVRAAALGLASRGYKNVYLVVDAIAGVAPDTISKAMKEMADAGVKITTTAEVLSKLSQ